MNFNTWIESEELSPTQLVDKLGVSRQTIHNLKRGKYRPSLDLAIKIKSVSKGKVPVESWGIVK